MNRCTRVQQCNREEEMWATALCPSSWLSRPWLLKHGIILMLSMENELANNWFTVTPSPLPCCASGSLWCSLICASCVWRGLTVTQATLRQHVTADFWYELRVNHLWKAQGANVGPTRSGTLWPQRYYRYQCVALSGSPTLNECLLESPPYSWDTADFRMCCSVGVGLPV